MSEVRVVENFVVPKSIIWVINLPNDKIKKYSVMRFTPVVDTNYYRAHCCAENIGVPTFVIIIPREVSVIPVSDLQISMQK